MIMSLSLKNYICDTADAIISTIWVKVNVTFPWQAVAGCWGGGVTNFKEYGALTERKP
jgi:hypothetical protein